MVRYVNEGCTAWGAQKCLYEGVIVPTALYGARAWIMRIAKRRKVNVLQ